MNEIIGVGLALIIGNVALVLSYLLSTSVILVKVLGSFRGYNSLAANFSSLLLLSNRVFISLTLVFFALAVDFGADIDQVIDTFQIFCFVCGLLHLLFPYKVKAILRILDWMFLKYRGVKHDKLEIPECRHYKIDKLSVISMFLFYMGFTLPTVLSLSFPEYKVTLFQLSFIANAFGSIISIAFIEKKLAKLCDKNNSKEELISEFKSIAFGRALGMFFYSGVLFYV
jgi:hypothetical protein